VKSSRGVANPESGYASSEFCGPSLRTLRLKASHCGQVPAAANLMQLALVLLLFAIPAAPAKNSAEAAALQRKLDHLDENSRRAHPDPTPMVFAEQEVNAYLASGSVEFPAGVESVKLQFAPGVISGTSRVDFDKALAGARSANPLLSMFSGVHEVTVATHASGSAGQGRVQIDSVSLDGITVPNFVLELFIEKYLQPRYPQIGLDSRFAMPDRIDSARVGDHQISLVQR
jgi:hypothetical protein